MNATLKLLVAAGLAGALGACNNLPPVGDSVRNMAEGQKADATAPHEEAGALDGQKAARALEAYRAPHAQNAKAPPPTLLIPASTP